MFIWQFVANTVLDDLLDWIYAQIIGTGMLDVACAGLAYKQLSAGRNIMSIDMTK